MVDRVVREGLLGWDVEQGPRSNLPHQILLRRA